ncbi:MAG: hypothetical protein OXR66_09245 [Candidatus Woesearchaeota archaeon]|nr:hypothetical protein [Candidatus Woesearchaeota archaeon]
MQNEDWEVSLTVFYEHNKRKYKVTRRLPSMTVAETKIFDTEKEAQAQFKQWS